MKNSLFIIEQELRPLFEAGIAYNLVLLECRSCMDDVDNLEQFIEALEPQLQDCVTKFISNAFSPKITLEKVKEELCSAMGENYTQIYYCLVKIKSQCPPWSWNLFRKKTRNQFQPDILISIYFKLRREYDEIKIKNKKFTIPDEIVNFLNELRDVRNQMTNMMISVDTYELLDSIYLCRIFCHEKNTSRVDAFKIALSQVKNQDPLNLVQHSVIGEKKFNDWDKILLTLGYMTSNTSNSKYLSSHLSSIHRKYQQLYVDHSALTYYRSHLEKWKRSLHAFYFSKQGQIDNHNKADPIAANTIIKTVMTNYAMLYAFMITHSTFFLELEEFARRVKNRMKSKMELPIFLNAISNLAKFQYAPESWSEKLNNIEWAEIAHDELTSIQSLFSHQIDIQHWGYYLFEEFYPSPIFLLQEFVKVRDACKNKFKSLKHDVIKEFELKVKKDMAYMMLKLLQPIFHLPPQVIIKKNYPFELIDRNKLDLEKKLSLALSIEQGTYTNEFFLANVVDDFETLEKLHMGLAYHYHNSFNSSQTSMNAFVSILDGYYAKPVNDKKFKDGKKLADNMLGKFLNRDYSLQP